MRLFTNLETETRKLLQVVLFAQPELDERLNQHSFRQLRQRITFSYCLRPLTLDEAEAYVQHRLSVAGSVGQPLFDHKNTRVLALASKGVPRLINILAHKALLLSFGEGAERVEYRHVKGAIIDTQDTKLSYRARWFWFMGLSLICVTSVLGVQLFYGAGV